MEKQNISLFVDGKPIAAATDCKLTVSEPSAPSTWVNDQATKGFSCEINFDADNSELFDGIQILEHCFGQRCGRRKRMAALAWLLEHNSTGIKPTWFLSKRTNQTILDLVKNLSRKAVKK